MPNVTLRGPIQVGKAAGIQGIAWMHRPQGVSILRLACPAYTCWLSTGRLIVIGRRAGNSPRVCQRVVSQAGWEASTT